MIHTWRPVGLHGRFLLLRVLAPVAFDLDDEVQEILVALSVIHQHDKVGRYLRDSKP